MHKAVHKPSAQVHSPKDDRKEVNTLPYGRGEFAASDERTLWLSTYLPRYGYPKADFARMDRR